VVINDVINQYTHPRHVSRFDDAIVRAYGARDAMWTGRSLGAIVPRHRRSRGCVVGVEDATKRCVVGWTVARD
jgi:hypothetical protein